VFDQKDAAIVADGNHANRRSGNFNDVVSLNDGPIRQANVVPVKADPRTVINRNPTKHLPMRILHAARSSDAATRHARIKQPSA
jgi:hypothetical protein